MADNLVIHASSRDRDLDRNPIPVPDHDLDRSTTLALQRDLDHDRSRVPEPDLAHGSLLPTNSPLLPHHKLIAYQVARDLLLAVRAADIRDSKLRDEALRSAKSACLNCAEGAGRVTRADKARAFTIARGEAVEAAAAVEIAALCGDARPQAVREVARLADRLVALLTGLIR